jgi:hypothetical protein
MKLEPGVETRIGRRLFVLLLLVFALLSHGYIDNYDAETEFQTARALVQRGGFALSPGFEDASVAETVLIQRGHGVMQGREGQYYSWFGPGHAVTMAPFYLVGRGLARVFPSVEPAALAERMRALPKPFGVALGQDFFSRVLVSFHSPLFAALIGLILFQILGHMGFGLGSRVIAVLLACFATQLGPESRESMADTTGAFFLFWSLERVFLWARRSSLLFAESESTESAPTTPWLLVSAGAIAGWAFLVRPNQILPLFVLGLYVLLKGLARGKPKAGLWFGLGFVPFFAFFLAFNWWRFGSLGETGYSAGTSDGFWKFNPILGFFLLGLSPGKGVLLFSPLLWLVPLGIRRFRPKAGAEILVLLSILLLPWILTSFSSGWHSSQAWGVRYLTPGAVILVAFASASILDSLATRPQRFVNMALVLLTALSLLWNLGGWAAPYRGWFDLVLRPQVQEQVFPDVLAAKGDVHQTLFARPRLSPLLGHLSYARLNLSGAIPAGPSEQVYQALVGIPIETRMPPAPFFPEDAGFRHFWWLGLRSRFSSILPVLLAVLMLALLVQTLISLRNGTRKALKSTG